MKKKLVQFGWLFIGVALISIGIAMMNKSGLGQTAYSGFANSIGQVIRIKSGTMLIVFNMSCVFGQLILLRNKFRAHQWLQVVVAYLSGLMVNFWVYDFELTASFIPVNYFSQWGVSLLGIMTISCGVAIVMASETIKMPLEAFVLVISEKIQMAFSSLRTLVDVFSILGSLCLILIFKLDISALREGTWISMVLLGSSMRVTFPWAKGLLRNSYQYLGIKNPQPLGESL